MPYKNIVWVKLKLELLSDYRFTDLLSDSQKLLYICLILLSGDTENAIPNDSRWIRRRLNLISDIDTIEKDLIKILETYPKLIKGDTTISFVNFQELHNYKFGKSQKSIRDVQEEEKEEEEEHRKSFELIWKKYPKKLGKKKSFSSFKGSLKRGATAAEISSALDKYLAYIEVNKTEDQFIKHGSTFFNNWEDWRDYEPPKPKIISRTQLPENQHRGKVL